MSIKILQVGIIGMGQYAAGVHVPNLRATGRAEVVAITRRNPQLLALAQRELNIPYIFTDWREMLEKTDLDAVVVSTPHNNHVEPTVAALQHGLHVLIDKPLATTVADAQTILRVSRQSDRVVAMAVNRRSDPGWQTAKRLLASGQIGQVRQINAVQCADFRFIRGEVSFDPQFLQSLETSPMGKAFLLDAIKADSWRNDPVQMGGDMFFDAGSHLVDLVLWLGGAPAGEVIAFSPADGPQRAAILTLQTRLTNGVFISITFNDHVAMGDNANFQGWGHLTAFGDRGTFSAEMPDNGSGPAGEMHVEKSGVKEMVTVEGESIDPDAGFVATVLDGAPVLASVEDAVNVVALIQGAYQSNAEGRLVRLIEQ